MVLTDQGNAVACSRYSFAAEPRRVVSDARFPSEVMELVRQSLLFYNKREFLQILESAASGQNAEQASCCSDPSCVDGVSVVM
jgi:hypothetical protein